MAGFAFSGIFNLLTSALTLAAGVAQTNTQVAGLEAQRDAAKMNADAKTQEAQVALQQANLEEEAQRKEARRVMGEQRAAIAQAGTGMLSSTNLRLVGESAVAAEQDALNIRYGGMLQAHGLLTQASQYRYEAEVADAMRGPTRAAGYIGAAAGALGNFAQGGGLSMFGKKKPAGPKTGSGTGKTTGGFVGPR